MAASPAGDLAAPTDVESLIARDLVRNILIVGPILVLAVGLWRGIDGGAAVALALLIVAVNWLLSAAMLGWAARTSPTLLMGVALGGFLVRLILLTAIGVGVKELDIVDWPVFCITLVVAYFGFLAWETRSISVSLASPGLKPRPGRAV